MLLQSSVHVKPLQSCPFLCNLWITARHALLSRGFPRQEYWSGFAFPTPGDRTCNYNIFIGRQVLYLQRHLGGPAQFSSVSQSCLFAIPWTAVRQSSLSITNSWILLKLLSIKSVMPSSHLILCHPLFLLPSIFPSIKIFPSESVLCIRWPKYWSFCFSISPSNEYSGLIFFRIDWLGLLVVQNKTNKNINCHMFF